MKKVTMKKISYSLSLIVLCGLLMSSCKKSSDEDSSDTKTFDNNYFNERDDVIKGNTQTAGLIVVGTITDVSPSPNLWSGAFRTDQEVSYNIESILKGSYSQSSLTVSHLLVSGSRNADADSVSLSPSVFTKGGKFIIFLRKNVDGAFEDFDENVGTIPFSLKNEEAVRQYL